LLEDIAQRAALARAVGVEADLATECAAVAVTALPQLEPIADTIDFEPDHLVVEIHAQQLADFVVRVMEPEVAL
jgi:hypothetical protein